MTHQSRQDTARTSSRARPAGGGFNLPALVSTNPARGRVIPRNLPLGQLPRLATSSPPVGGFLPPFCDRLTGVGTSAATRGEPHASDLVLVVGHPAARKSPRDPGARPGACEAGDAGPFDLDDAPRSSGLRQATAGQADIISRRGTASPRLVSPLSGALLKRDHRPLGWRSAMPPSAAQPSAPVLRHSLQAAMQDAYKAALGML